MKCYIIDDEAYAIDTLSKYIEKSTGLALVGSTTDVLIGLEEVKKHEIDLVFLDIDMPVLNGIEIAKLLPKSVLVIFTTAHPQYAVDGFNLEIADFLLKPISLSRFLQSIEKVKKSTYPANNSGESFLGALFVNPGAKGKVIKVLLRDIVYVEGLKNYVIIHTISNRKLITYLTMVEIQSSLPTQYFIRIHKSYLINKEKILLIEGNKVKLEPDIDLPIGASYRDQFLQEISAKTIKSKRNT